MKIARYGRIKDRPDPLRDRCLKIEARVPLPASCDLRTSGFLPPVYDQGELGSCTANAIAAAVDFERKRQGEPFLTPSRLFIYYNERALEGTTGEDAGAEIRDGIKSVALQGVCPESEWAYSDQGSQFAVRPPDQCYAAAVKFKTLAYSRVTQDEYFIKHCLAMLGRPVVAGIDVFDGFESDVAASSGIIPLPSSGEKPIGGHAVAIVGYDDAWKMFLGRNSWGSDWGQEGYFQIPYGYVLNAELASDFWVIETEA